MTQIPQTPETPWTETNRIYLEARDRVIEARSARLPHCSLKLDLNQLRRRVADGVPLEGGAPLSALLNYMRLERAESLRSLRNNMLEMAECLTNYADQIDTRGIMFKPNSLGILQGTVITNVETLAAKVSAQGEAITLVEKAAGL